MSETVAEALKRAGRLLSARQTQDAALDAEYLLAEALRTPRLSLRLQKTRLLSETELRAFNAMLDRRAAREPLQYILGTQMFMGLEIKTDCRALIPRFDTECVCEAAIARVRDGMEVLDLCTGTGAIALAIKHARPKARVTGTDISGDALALARENARRLGLDAAFLQGDLFQAVGARRFGLIVSNPPYIPDGLHGQLQREVEREPALALFGGADGLDFYRRIAAEAPDRLLPGGWLVLETGDGEGDAIAALLQPRFEEITRFDDWNGLERGLAARLREGEADGSAV